MSDNQEFSQSENPYSAPDYSPAELSPQVTPQDASEIELRAFVGSKADYYLEKWSPIIPFGGHAAGFNWPAFFLAPFWISYRKMYAVLFILLGLICVEAMLEDIIFCVILGQEEVPMLVDRGTSLVIAIICGMFANRCYLWHAEKKIAEIRAQGFEGEQLLWQLSKCGGTSLIASLGMTFLYLAIFFVVFIAYAFLVYGW